MMGFYSLQLIELYTFVEVLEDAENDFAEFQVECPGT